MATGPVATFEFWRRVVVRWNPSPGLGVGRSTRLCSAMTVGGLADVDDRELVARALAGDDLAFGELLRRHQRAALRVAAVIAGSTDDAADIVQDAFVRAHGRLGSFRGDGSARSWLLRVVANGAKNHPQFGCYMTGTLPVFSSNDRLINVGQPPNPSIFNVLAGNQPVAFGSSALPDNTLHCHTTQQHAATQCSWRCLAACTARPSCHKL